MSLRGELSHPRSKRSRGSTCSRSPAGAARQRRRRRRRAVGIVGVGIGGVASSAPSELGGRMVEGGRGFRPRVFTLYLVGRQFYEGGVGAGTFRLASSAAAHLTGGVPPLRGECSQPPLNLWSLPTFCSQVHHAAVGARIEVSTHEVSCAKCRPRARSHFFSWSQRPDMCVH